MPLRGVCCVPGSFGVRPHKTARHARTCTFYNTPGVPTSGATGDYLRSTVATCRHRWLRAGVAENTLGRTNTVLHMTPALHLVAACLALVVLTFAVGIRLLYVRTMEMREKRVHPQAASTSIQLAAKLQNVQAADNFRNLFETPVLFYSLAAIAIASSYTPAWLSVGAWVYVGIRVAHSLIHCTYNRVMHRFAAFGIGFLLLVCLWVAFVVGLLSKSAA